MAQMASAPELIVEESADDLARTVAERALDLLAAALGSRAVAHLVVTGGGILEAVLQAVRHSSGREAVDWSRVHVWWGDERFVAPDSPDRNDTPAFADLFDALPVDPARIHRMPSTASGYGDDVDAAAAAYASDLADAAAADGATGDVPAFDVVLLGIGPDGHCASLFPHHPGLERAEAAIGVRDSPKPPPTRISLSFRALDAAREIWFIASGDGKADAVARAHAPGADYHDVPCSRPRGVDRTLWLVDRDAAAQLPT